MVDCEDHDGWRVKCGLWLVLFVYNVSHGYDGELGDDVIVRRSAQLRVWGAAGSHRKAKRWRLRRSARASWVAVQCIRFKPSHPLSNATLPIWHVLRLIVSMALY